MQQLTFLDLCSGIGGFRLGLESAGHRCIGYCEYDRFARASYEAMYDTEGEWKADDVTKLKSEDVPYADMPSLLMIKEIEKKTGANYLEEIDRHTKLTEKQELKIKQMTTDIANMIEKDTTVPQGNDGIF